MKKVGILSMQRVVNHGSFLQAYALKKTIESLIPQTTCEFLDLPVLKEEKNVQQEKPMSQLKYFAHKVLGHRQVCLDQQAKKHSDQYKKIYQQEAQTYLGLRKQYNYNTNYDTVVIGSDEVFNCTQEDTYWGQTMRLFGEGIESNNIISYAGSFGYTTLNRLEEFGLREAVQKNLSRFNAISVRDHNSAEIVEVLSGVKPEMHLDPVLIYPFAQEVKLPLVNGEFILIYQYSQRINDSGFVRRLKEWAREKKMKIISVFGFCPWADMNLLLRPLDVLGYFKKASYVVTDTFHGCVMSIKYNRQFVALSRASNQNKLNNLLEQFDLTNQIIQYESDFAGCLEESIDWTAVNIKIAAEQERTNAYLKENLQNRNH